MQNLPVIAAPSVTSAQATAPTDNRNAAYAAEPFGNVLARQRANVVSAQEGKDQDKQQLVSASANDATIPSTGIVPGNLPADILAALLPPTEDKNSIATVTKEKTVPKIAAPSGVGTLPGDMLAMLMPGMVTPNSPATVTKEKTVPQIAAPGGVGTLPGDMLGMLMPGVATSNSPATIAKDKTVPQIAAPNGGNNLPGDMLAMMVPSVPGTNSPSAKDKVSSSGGVGTLPSDVLTMMSPTLASSARNPSEKNPDVTITNVDNKPSALTVITESADASLQSAKSAVASGAAGVVVPSPVSVITGKENAFSVTLADLNKDGAETGQFVSSTTKTQMQQITSHALDSLLQSNIMPIAASQSGAAQTAQMVLNTPVTDLAWGNEFNQKITWMATQHQQTAELHLNPPNLGPLDVVLKVSGDQATALFTSPHAAVREAVELALPQLRNMLADSGITLGNAMVSDQSPKDQQAWQASQQQKGSSNLSATLDSAVVSGSPSSVASASLVSRHLGMVDTFA